MKNRKHFFFKINKDILEKASSIESIVKNLRLPRNKFPRDFFATGENFFCAGYFVSYYPDINTDQLVTLCKKHEWKNIAHIIGDFLILFVDLNSRKLFILTDQTGKFPCYFSATKDKVIISTSFYSTIKTLPSLTLDIIGGLDFIHRNNNVTDRTIIRGVRLIPPATLLTINHDDSYSLESMIDADNFTNQPFEKYTSIEKFSDVFFSALDMLVKERLQKINGIKFSSEISSGFDSSLISFLVKKNSNKPFTCYSRTAKATIRDSDPRIVSEFARKHNLNVKFIPYDHIFPFSTKEDLEWIRRIPNQIIKSEVYNHFLIMQRDNNIAYFTGDGGDEIYQMDEDTQNLYLRFPVQMEYFERLLMRHFEIDKLLTKKSLEILFDKKRFQEKRPYPLYVSNSAATIHTDTFPLSWETEMWPITPFADPRLVQIARGIPKINGKKAIKQKTWEKRLDIFPPGHFIPKARGGPDNQIRRYLIERTEFVISVLENSLLGEKGWAKSSEIIDNVQGGRASLYYESNVVSYLSKLIELEYFLQRNNVTVPN